MRISELKKQFTVSLSGSYPSEEIASFFTILSEYYLGLSRLQLAMDAEKEIAVEDVEKFEEVIKRLQDQEPIQYIIGETEFFGLPFKVNKHTLIPRPETEELVEWILSNSKFRTQNSELLDIGTGSGCIAISLAKKLPYAKVSAMDFSAEALKMAAMNAKRNEVVVDFIEKDVLALQSLPKQYDVIVSNPPYVRELEKEMMQKNVLEHEPDSALFVSDEEPLLFYRAIALLAKAALKPYGKLYFEINEYLGKQMFELLEQLGFVNVEVKKDIFGKDRMIKCNLDE